MNCLRGFAPRRYPLFKSVSKSAEELAADAVIFAEKRLMSILPGLMTPNIIFVNLPIGPTGVVSVSPVTRQAISARKNDITTAIVVCHHDMPNVMWPR